MLSLWLLEGRAQATGFVHGMGGLESDIGLSIAVDGSSNSYVTGYFGGTTDFDPGMGVQNLTSAGESDVFIVSYDANGDFRFAYQIGGSTNDVGHSIALDGAGNIYVTGSFQGTVDFDPGLGVQPLTSAGDNDVFLASYDTNGAFRFAYQLGATASDVGRGIALDGANNIYVVGYFQGTADFDFGAGTQDRTSAGSTDIFVASYDANGAFRFAHHIGDTLGDFGLGLAIDGSGNSYVTGFFRGTADFDPGAGTASRTSAGDSDIFIASYEANGDFRFAHQIGGTAIDEGNSIAVESGGTSYVTGLFRGTADFDPGAGTASRTSAGDSDIFIASYEANGDFRFAHQVGNTVTDVGVNVAIDGSANSYITGYFGGTTDFDPGAGTESRTSAGGDDIFLASYDTNGDFRFASQVGGPSSDQGFGIAVDGSSHSYVTGYFLGTADFDPDLDTENRTSAGLSDIFVARYEPTGALPVELSAFTAQAMAQDLVLQWQTSSETNNVGFAVELTPPGGRTWHQHGFVEGAGTTLEARQYNYQIPDLVAGTYRVRLRQVDYDGAFEYSSELEVSIELREAFKLSAVYPNPFRDEAQFSLQLQTDETVSVELYDLLGRMVRQVHQGPLRGQWTHSFTLPAEGLTNGLYMVRVRSEGFHATRQVRLIR
ncbi:MAG: SBBP repeat-containing protein [Bacteroidota bacterium]